MTNTVSARPIPAARTFYPSSGYKNTTPDKYPPPPATRGFDYTSPPPHCNSPSDRWSKPLPSLPLTSSASFSSVSPPLPPRPKHSSKGKINPYAVPKIPPTKLVRVPIACPPAGTDNSYYGEREENGYAGASFKTKTSHWRAQSTSESLYSHSSSSRRSSASTGSSCYSSDSSTSMKNKGDEKKSKTMMKKAGKKVGGILKGALPKAVGYVKGKVTGAVDRAVDRKIDLEVSKEVMGDDLYCYRY
eukprot:Nk52_evm1s1523 gene=Nk52_evmTU1s1523